MADAAHARDDSSRTRHSSEVRSLENRKGEPSTRSVEASEPISVKASPQPKSVGRLRRVLLLLGPIALGLAGIYIYLSGGRFVTTDNAYVKADKIAVATDVPGFVANVYVRQNEHVTKGQLLARLDDEPYRIALHAARSQLNSIRNELRTLQATYSQNIAQVEQAKTDVSFYQAQFDRQQQLSTRGVSTQAAFDQARRDLENAQSRVVVAQRQAEVTLAQLGGSIDTPLEANPRYQQAEAHLNKAERDLRLTEIRAPRTGIVTNVDRLQEGNYLPSAQAAVSLVASDEIWVEANLKETDLTYLGSGNDVEFTVDAYPEVEFTGKVESLNPATGAEFSVLPAQNASGNWVKVVQRIPVRIKVEQNSSSPTLRTGMSAEVSVDTGHRRSFSDLLRMAKSWVGLK